MAFGNRKQPTPETSPAPEPAALSTTDRLNAVLAERSEIHTTLAEHRGKRNDLLSEDGTAALDAIRELAIESDRLKLRLEQIALRIPDIERELDQERREAFEAAWRNARPSLAAAEDELTEAIRTFFAAMAHANAVYGRAAGFGDRLREFVRPPPTIIFNEWALREYLKAIDRRQGIEPAPSEMVEFTVPDRAPWQPRFTPRKVPRHLIEQVSGATSRKVRVLHDVNVTNLNFGHRKLFAGDEMMVPGPASFALVYSGVAVYVDTETAEAELATA